MRTCGSVPSPYQHLVGMTEDEARKALEAEGLTMRVTSADGEFFLGTSDYRTDRLNVGLTNGKVTMLGGFG